MEELVRTIGRVKCKRFEKDFDKIVDEYKLKAKKMGYSGALKFKKEHGNILIFAVI